MSGTSASESVVAAGERKWLELEHTCLPLHWQASVLLEMMLEFGVNSHKLLCGTGIFVEDVTSASRCISARQFIRLVRNCQSLYASDDLAFRYGQRLLPGCYDEYSHALASATTLAEYLDVVAGIGSTLSPLLQPKKVVSDGESGLAWYGSLGQIGEPNFFTPAYCLALKNHIRARSGEKLPWRFEFAFPAPQNIAHYRVNLGEAIQFSMPVTRMLVPRDLLHHPLQGGSQLSFQRALKLPQKIPSGFIFLVRQALCEHLCQEASLNYFAHYLGLSTTTFKRKLALHKTSFREQLDSARLEVAVTLFRDRGCTNEQVAKLLGYYDDANLRRSFKRWTGFSPQEYLATVTSVLA